MIKRFKQNVKLHVGSVALVIFGILMLSLLLFSCTPRNSYPSANPADVIACRHYASRFGALRVNGEFNACMEEAGYRPR